jgi:DNA-directed RNA polymerase subunit RPC12/RpoP
VDDEYINSRLDHEFSIHIPIRPAMKKYPCPACHKPTISFWQKHTIGPMRKIQCSHCGSFIGVPFLISTVFVLLSMIGTSLGGVAALLAIKSASLLLALGVFMLGMALSGASILWLYERLVPLVVKNT